MNRYLLQDRFLSRYTGSKTATDLAVGSDKNFYREKTIVGKCKVDAKIDLTIAGEKEKGERMR